MYLRYVKRIADALAAGILWILLLPLFIVVFLVVLFTIGPPIFFLQERPGQHGRLFTIIKFRTMHLPVSPGAEIERDTGRLTVIGNFLRSLSLDEMPELLNVIRGDMSLVGPRPLLKRYYPYFSKFEAQRFLVRPGITGLAQVSGRNDLPWKERFALDVYYVKHASLLLDISILARTVLHLFHRKGLRVDPGATMIDFDEYRKKKKMASHKPMTTYQ
jgi:lipopolysaccharide/colanic/teichoic acid biosynthesis glycosyltransferase